LHSADSGTPASIPGTAGSWETSSLSESLAAVSIPTTAARPLHWVNQHECDGATSVVKRVCMQGDSLCPTGPGTRGTEPSDHGRGEPARPEQPRNTHSDYGRRAH